MCFGGGCRRNSDMMHYVAQRDNYRCRLSVQFCLLIDSHHPAGSSQRFNSLQRFHSFFAFHTTFTAFTHSQLLISFYCLTSFALFNLLAHSLFVITQAFVYPNYSTSTTSLAHGWSLKPMVFGNHILPQFSGFAESLASTQ